MVPFCPRTVMPEPKVVVPLSSRSMRLPGPVLPRTMVPDPLSVPSPSKLRMPFWLRLMVPPVPSDKPFTTRCLLLTLLAMSSTPLSVTPSRKLALLLNATSLPVPVVLIVPPVIRLPNWLMTLSALTLIVPPVLLMLCPAPTCRAALLGIGPAPTLMVPVLVVLPPPCRVSRKASMSMVPALLRVNIDWAVLMVTVLPAPMLAVSSAGPVGMMPQDQLAAVPQLPVTGFQVQTAAIADGADTTDESNTPACMPRRRCRPARATPALALADVWRAIKPSLWWRLVT